MTLDTYDVTYNAKSTRYPGTIEILRPRIFTNSINSAITFVKNDDSNFVSVIRVYNERYHDYP